ncbi:TPA: hypothetical protein LR348_000393 [Enterobacter hormaechei]|nr:hypothetical protein [Enterobacter hormaechei]
MSTITKQAVQAVADLKVGYTLGHADVAILNELARIALASLEAEAVADVVAWSSPNEERPCDVRLRRHDINHGPLYTAPPAPASAEPLAWLWSHRKHPSEVSLVRPEDDERAEGAHWSGWSCQALYAAPPVPVSVPDELAGKSFDYIANKFQVSPSEAQWILVGWNARSAAMLQGAEPVTTDCKLPELTDSQCLEFLAVAFRHASIKGDIEFDDIRLGLKMALEAAPQQEVKP